jgi:hypothetical protein
MTPRETVYAVLVALGVVVPMYYNVQYMAAGGNLLADFFTVPLQSAITASVLFDLLIAFAAFNVLLFSEGRNFGTRNFIICVAVSWLVSFAAGLPLFLFFRERQKRLGLGQHV